MPRPGEDDGQGRCFSDYEKKVAQYDLSSLRIFLTLLPNLWDNKHDDFSRDVEPTHNGEHHFLEEST